MKRKELAGSFPLFFFLSRFFRLAKLGVWEPRGGVIVGGWKYIAINSVHSLLDRSRTYDGSARADL